MNVSYHHAALSFEQRINSSNSEPAGKQAVACARTSTPLNVPQYADAIVIPCGVFDFLGET